MFATASIALTALALVLFRRALAWRISAAGVALGTFLVLFLLIAYWALNELTGSGIDESVLFHVQVGLKGATAGDQTALIAFIIIMLITAVIVALVAYRLARDAKGHGAPAARKLGGALAMVGAFIVNPTVVDVADLVTTYGTGNRYGNEAVATPPEYVEVDAISLDAGKKNLVLLYLESIERTYLDETVFPDLMPNLRVLEANALRFTDISQVVWSSWTIAGMVGSQCGIPLAGSGAGSDEFLPGATCVGDLLSDAGYDLNYMGGAPLEFAGKGTFYLTHGFNSVEGNTALLKQQDDPGYESIWGVYDDSLFELLTRKFDRLSAGDRPFGIATINVDTHHPSGGIVSDTCKNITYGDGRNAYLNAVHCTDQMVGDFIRHLLASPAMDNTVLVVLSDHLARPNSAWDMLNLADRRNLLFAYGPGIEPGTIDKPGVTIDIAPTVLTLLGADIEGLGYGRNLLGPIPSLRSGEKPLDELLEEQWPFLASLWSFPQLDHGIRVNVAENRAYLGERFAKLPVVFQVDEDLNVVDLLYNMDDGTTLPAKLTNMWYGNRFVWVDTCDRTAIFEAREAPLAARYCALAGNLGSPGLASFALPDGVVFDTAKLRPVFEGLQPEKAYFESMVETYRDRAMLVDAHVTRSVVPTGMVGDYLVRSSGGADAFESWIVNRDRGNKVRLKRGLTLLGLSDGAAPVKVAYKDTCGWGGEVGDPAAIYDTDFATAIERSAGQFGAYVVIAHSSAVCYKIDPDLETLFAGTDFQKWRDLWYEIPYVAVLAGNGHIEEFMGERGETLAVELRDFVGVQPGGAHPIILKNEVATVAGALPNPSGGAFAPLLQEGLCRYGQTCMP